MNESQYSNDRTKLKKKIIGFFVIVCSILIVSYGGIAIYSTLNSADSTNPDNQYATKYEFYQADWNEDIYLDPDYMELDRTISITDGAVTVGIAPENYVEYGDVVVFLAQYLQTIIDGDHEAYNTCFSDTYWEKHAEQNIFTPQKLYNILLWELEKEIVSENGIDSTVYTYSVQYMIRRNNGTFRRDIGSDAIKPQYLIIRETDGTIKIDDILTSK